MRKKNLLERLGLIQKMETASSLEAPAVTELKPVGEPEETAKLEEHKRLIAQIEQIELPPNEVAAHLDDAESFGEAFIADPKTEKSVSFIMDPNFRTISLAGGDAAVSTPEAINIDGFIGMDEFYRANGKAPDGPGTIFIIDSFASALPPSMPVETKRIAIQRVLEASGTSTDALVGDGLSRIEALDGLLAKIRRRAEDLTESLEREIATLEGKIERMRREIDEKALLRDKQEKTIENEISKIKVIIEFIAKQ